MSAIFGLVGEVGLPVRSDLRAMEAALRHWEPDSSGVWDSGSVALGCHALYSTPEAVGETQPLRNVEANVTVAADVRLDNRDELLDTLDGQTGRKSPSDADLVLRAYLKWGVECVSHLFGDFAFAVWDEKRQVLLCARDHVGIRPLFWHRSSTRFAFATEIKGLRALDGVGREVNDVWVAGLLAKVRSDDASTFYTDIARLQPGHRVIVTNGAVKIERYWDLDPHREVRLASDREYEDAFREKLVRAVRVRVRSHRGVGCEFSAGIDSGAVTCLAAAEIAPVPLNTFTFVLPPNRDPGDIKDSRDVVTEIALELGAKPTFLWGEGHDFLPNPMYPHDEPLRASLAIAIEELFAAAAASGSGVLLTGMGGDDLVSSQVSGYHEELLATGKWRELWRGLVFENQTVRRSLTSAIRVGYRALFDPNRERGPESREFLWMGVAPDFARRFNVFERFALRENDLRRGSVRARQRLRLLEAGLQPHFETCGLVARRHRLDRRHPLMDVRLLEFALALPLDQKVRAGVKRRMFKRSLRDVVPETLLLIDRKRVPTVPSYLIRTADSTARIVEILSSISESHPVRSYVDLSRIGTGFEEAMKMKSPKLSALRAARTAILLVQALDRLDS